MKKEENGEALAGAIIGLFPSDGTEPILTTVSAEDGSFLLNVVSLMASMWFVRNRRAGEAM